MTRIKSTLLAAICATLAAFPLLAGAQLKLKDPTAPATPSLTTPGNQPSPAAPATDSTLTEKEKAAVEAAQKWLALLDRKEYGKAWDESAPLFQSKVTRAQWLDGLPKTRGPFGAMKTRELEGIGVPNTPKDQVGQEFLQIGFASQFENQDKAQEAVTLMLVKGAWRPVGYLVR